MSENTLASPSKFDVLEKVGPNDLIFPLAEHDVDAPPTILFWVERRRARARLIEDSDKRREELQQITEAEFIAFEMEIRQGKKEAPTETRVRTYSGVQVEKSALDDVMPALRGTIAEADYHINNALELARKAHELGGIDDAQLGHINDAARTIHAMSLDLSPRRAAYLAEPALPLEDKADG